MTFCLAVRTSRKETKDSHHFASTEPKLSRMLQAITWCENQLEDRAIFPTPMVDIVAAASGPVGRSTGMSDSDDDVDGAADDMVIDRPAQKRSAESDATDS